MKKFQTVLITGLSGSGKSTALNTLEDMGFFCIDNFPSAMISHLIKSGMLKELRRTALSMDVREGRFIQHYSEVIESLRKTGSSFKILFLEADSKTVQRRFSITRRRHPLAQEGSVIQAIRLEKEILKGLRRKADYIIDTSKLSPRALHQVVQDYFSALQIKPRLNISVMSFGFHHGTPEEADLLMDVRFIPNPNFVPQLYRLNGTHASVKKYVLRQKETKGFLKRYLALLRFLIPRYRKEGKSYLTIAVGCTGGQHRSVVIAEEVFRSLRALGTHCHVIHRDLGLSLE